MLMKRNICRLFFVTVLTLLLSPTDSFCEYNLATGEEEHLLISTAQEIKMGESIAARVAEKMKLYDNYTQQERVDQIGQRIANVSDRKDLVYHFYIIDDESENAFSLPGGYVYIFRGLIERLDTDDEIAAILAHEVGHICARHSIKRLQESIGMQALGILMIRGSNDAYTRVKANQALGHLILSHARSHEFESDRLAVRYLKAAGFDENAAVSVLDKLLKIQMNRPMQAKRYWYTHPYLAARRSAINKEITGQLDFNDYINVTTDDDYIIPR